MLNLAFLEIAYPQLNDVRLYIVDGDVIKVNEHGRKFPMNERDYRHAHIVFSVTQKPGIMTCYIRVHTNSSMYLPMEIHSRDHLENKLSTKLGQYSLFYGLIIGLFIFNIILLYSTRDITILYYLLFILGAMKIQLSLDGFGMQYLWVGMSWLDNLSIEIFITNIMTILFTREFLQMKKTSPWFNKVMISDMVLGVFLVVANFFTHAMMNSLATYYTLLTDFIGFTAAVLALRKGVIAAKIFLFSWVFIIIASFLRGLLAVGIAPAGPVVESILLYGIALTMVMFSYSFVDRYNAMRKDLIVEMDVRKQAETVLLSKNQELVSTNEELQAALEELESINEEFNAQNEKLIQTQHELLLSEERFRSYTEHAPVGLLIYKYETWVYANPAASVITGYSTDELLKMRYWEFVHPDDKIMVRERGKARIRGENPDTDYQIKIITKDGDIRWINIRVSAFMLQNEMAVLVMMIDITSQKELEEALRVSEQKFSVAFHAAPVIIGISRLDNGCFIEVNDAFCSILGHRREDVIGMSSIELGILTPDTRDYLVNAISKNRTIVGFETAVYAINGEKKDVLFYAKVIGINNIDCVLAIAEDITQRHVLEREIIQERERLLVILKSIRDGVVALDAQGRVMFMNDAAGKILGMDSAMASGKVFVDLISFKSWRAITELQKNAKRVDTGPLLSISSGDYLIKSIDGPEIRVTLDTAPIFSKDGVLAGNVVVIRDVTEQLLVQEELLKMQKLESIGVLAAGIAHDFNNILMAIVGNARIVQHYCNDKLEICELIEEIISAVEKSKGLTMQMRSLAKGWLPVKQLASINEIIREYAVFTLRGSKIKLDMDLSQDVPIIKIDSGQIGQVIQNIIINASQAMGGVGTLSITTKSVNIGNGLSEFPLPDGVYVKITIADTGPGIPPEKISQIFDPFFTTKEKGSGLGLYSSYGIIRKHDGFIFATNLPLGGAVFTIFLPVK